MNLEEEIKSMEERKNKLEKLAELQSQVAVLEKRMLMGSDALMQDVRIIAQEVFDHYKMPISSLHSRARPEAIVVPRHALWFILYHKMGIRICQIGKIMERDHGSICNALASFQDRLDSNPRFKADFESLAAQCVEKVSKMQKTRVR